MFEVISRHPRVLTFTAVTNPYFRGFRSPRVVPAPRMSAKKYLRMPTAQSVAAKNESEERMMMALRKHVMYERQRKKQEQEAEVEEERLRKEREARERRDVMTLGQTREKIQALELRHRELQVEKEELFLTLKKLLNEDENRKKQQQKESNEMYAMQNIISHQGGSFMPPRPMGGGQDRPPPPQQGNQNPSPIGSGNGPPISVGGNSMHNRPGSSNSSSGAPQNAPPMNKRTRSPSPTPQHGHYYKTGGGSGNSGNGQGGPNNAPGGSSQGQGYTHAPKMEEGRRVGEVSRAVLWNKQSQYPFYQGPPMPPNPSVDPSGRFFAYSTIPSQQLRPNYADMTAHMTAAGVVGVSKPPPDWDLRHPLNFDQPSQQQQQQMKQQQQQQQQQQKKEWEDLPPPHLRHPIVYDVLRWQQEQGKLPPGAPASITRGYMKRD